MTEPDGDLTGRIVQTLVGVSVLRAALGRRAARRLRVAGLASAGCSLGLLAIAVGTAALGMLLLAASTRVVCRLLGIPARK